MFKELEVVKSNKDVPFYNVKIGDKGTIVHVYRWQEEEPSAYEVEFRGGIVVTLERGEISKVGEEELDKDDSIFIECECGAHALGVYSTWWNNEHQEISISMFNFGNQKRTIWHRIKLAWKLLWKDEYYNDQVSMNNEEASKLKSFLNKNIE